MHFKSHWGIVVASPMQQMPGFLVENVFSVAVVVQYQKECPMKVV